MAEKLTTRRIASLVGAGIPCDVRDTQAKGLVLRIRGRDLWSWNVRRTVTKTDYRMDLGDCWSLEEARDFAAEIDKRIRERQDPWDRAPGARTA